MVEVKKTPAKTILIEVFQEKLDVYYQSFIEQKILPAFFSLSGLTQEALLKWMD